jgi:hypothetical protein
MTTTKHCKMTYNVIVPYSEINNSEVISVNGLTYEIIRNPRPTKTESELMCVFVNGVKYNSLAKFLKSLNK